jgi:transglutaminase-like putative cysteine protease
MLLRLLHRTTFTYAGKAHDSFNEVRLRPVNDIDQACLQFSLHTDPAAETREYTDFYGNTVHYFDISEGHRKLVVEANSEVQTVPDDARRPVPSVPLEALEAAGRDGSHAEFLADSHYVPLDVSLWREAQDALVDGRGDVWSDVRRLGQHVYRTMAYRPKTTGVSTRATDALKLRMGVCQDFAHVAIGLCRCSGIPARYVSGYFLNRFRRAHEHEASHAWMEAFIPGYGWAAFDPTHDRPANENYIKVAAGRDYADIRPVSGTYRGAKTRSLRVDVQVRQAPAPAAVGG